MKHQSELSWDKSSVASLLSFKRLVNVTAALTFFLIALGSLVRATDSGLACPDWPLCYDKLVPLFDTQIFLEWFHRVIAGIVSLLVLAVLVIALKNRDLRRTFSLQLSAAVIVLLIQIVLGGLTVLKLLDPTTVSSHLINALLFFGLMIWISVRAKAISTQILTPHAAVIKAPTSFKVFMFTLAGLVFVQIGLGGSVSTTHSGLVCPDFPTCHGLWVPPLSKHIWLQMGHRYLAYVIFALACMLTLFATRLTLSPALRKTLRLLPTLLAIQILLGVVNVVMHLPIWASVLHLANATAIFAILLRSAVQLVYDSQSLDQGGSKLQESDTDSAAKQPGYLLN